MKISNPAFNYDQLGQKYSGFRRTDPRIAKYIWDALGSAETVLNVGAGTGSYEPDDRYVVAVEPSIAMRKQRPANGRVPAIIATADSLPFDDNSFDASMALVTIHHWADMEKGLKELRRVTKGKVLIMTFDPASSEEFWKAEYFPELIEIEKQRDPAIDSIVHTLGGACEVIQIPIPLDCVDGFQEAFYGRPEAFLEKGVRQNQSTWGFLPEGMEEVMVKRLADELTSGEWDRKYGHFRTQESFTCAMRLVIARP